MNTDLLATLFYPVHSGAVSMQDAHRYLFLNACGGAEMPSHLNPANLDCVQPLYHEAAYFTAKDYRLFEGADDLPSDHYDAVFVLTPQNKYELQGLLARALLSLKENGLLIAAGANNAGGARLKKMLQTLGLSVTQDSRNKARVVTAQKKQAQLDVELLARWLKEADWQAIEPSPEDDFIGRYQSRPGIFGWDKVDSGSRLLLHTLFENRVIFSGRGADLGCGYGYLSCGVLSKLDNGITSLDIADCDARSLQAAAMNLRKLYKHTSLTVIAHHCDLTQDVSHILSGLDWIIMNPPFHAGKNTDQDIGKAFIINAAKALKPKSGKLYMVANRQLAYEHTLEQHFGRFSKLKEEQGFKIFEALT